MTRPSAAPSARVLRPIGNQVLRQSEINLRLAQQQTRHDPLIEVGVREKADPQDDLGAACSLASRSRAARASGSSVSIVFTSAHRRSWSLKYASTFSVFSR